jgi:hypothetical protein
MVRRAFFMYALFTIRKAGTKAKKDQCRPELTNHLRFICVDRMPVTLYFFPPVITPVIYHNKI